MVLLLSVAQAHEGGVVTVCRERGSHRPAAAFAVGHGLLDLKIVCAATVYGNPILIATRIP